MSGLSGFSKKTAQSAQTAQILLENRSNRSNLERFLSGISTRAERVEVDETLPFAEENWDCPEQTEIDKGVEPDFPFTMKTRQGMRGRNKKKYNSHGEDFVVDRIVLDDVADSIVGVDEIMES